MSDDTQITGISRRTALKASIAAAAAGAVPTAAMAGMFKSSVPVTDVTWMPAVQLAKLVARKKISPVEITQHFLARIDALEPKIHAYITVDTEGALAQAKQAEQQVMRGERLGPMHGLPISIKDLVMTRGLRTTYGSRLYENHIPTRDEIQVERLRAAGAIILGKTNTAEFGRYSRTRTYVGGETLNPWDTERISGASSGGSAAAVAAGISTLSIASDGGGSTRIPACFNGVFGFQPSAGRIPMRIPKKTVMSSTGPATLHVEDAALIMSVIGGPDARDPSAIARPNPDFSGLLNKGVKKARIAWTPNFGRIPTVDSRVEFAISKAVKLFSDAGADVDMPEIYLPENSWEVFWMLNASATGDSLSSMTPAQFEQLTPPLKKLFDRINASPPLTPENEMAALEQRAGLKRWADSIFETYDFICSPTINMVAPKIPDDWQQPYEHPLFATQISTPFTHIANVLGLPAASVPCGFVDGMPIGLQIISRRFNDVQVLQAAKTFARLQPWMDQHPAMVS